MKRWWIKLLQLFHFRCPKCAAPTFVAHHATLTYGNMKYRKCTRCRWSEISAL